MTYLDYINAFWAEHRRAKFSASEIAFFFVLLAEFNSANWPAKLPVSNVLLCGLLGCSVSMIRSSRDGLKQRGVVDFGQGKSKKSHTVYRLVLGKASRRGKRSVNNSANGFGIGYEINTQSVMESVTQSVTRPDYIGKEVEVEKEIPPMPPFRRAAGGSRNKGDPVKAEARREFALREKRKRLDELRAERSLIVPNPAAAEISELYAAQERKKDRERQRLTREIWAIEQQIEELNQAQKWQ